MQRPGRQKGSSQRGLTVGALAGRGLAWALCLAAAACADPAPPASAPLPELGPPVDAGPGAVTLTVQLIDQLGGATVNGPLRLRVLPQAGVATLIDVPPGPGGAWPEALSVTAPPGPVQLTAFVDRDADGLLDGCPFPASPDDALRADSYDNLSGVWSGVAVEGAAVQLVMERSLCGPGEPGTGLTGVVTPAEGAPILDAPVLLRLLPVGDVEAEDGASAPLGPPLVLPLFPNGITGATPFSVGALVPGRYQLVAYEDADGDGLPTPCGDGVGGGDRWLARYPEGGGAVVIAPGRRTEVSFALAQPAGCAEALTGVSMEIALAPDLAGGAAEPDGLLDGPLWLALIPSSGGSPVTRVVLAATAADLPRRVTVSGLPEGVWRVAVWIDRDGDEQYGPCGGLAGGLDAVSGRIDDLRIVDGRLVDPGALQLTLSDCDLDTAAVVGSLRVGTEPGAVGSGRPVRLDLVSPQGERLSVQLAENHQRLDGADNGTRSGPFSVSLDVPAGSYLGVAYLDSDRDGAFVSCALDPFGDRAAATAAEVPALGAVRIEPGLVFDLGEIPLVALGCAVPDTGVTAEVILSGDVAPPIGPVRLHIEEQGGFVDDVLLLAAIEVVDQPVSGARRPLAPGRYRLTVYADTNGNGRYDDCDSEGFDAIAARLDVTLGAMDPMLTPRFLLGPACGG